MTTTTQKCDYLSLAEQKMTNTFHCNEHGDHFTSPSPMYRKEEENPQILPRITSIDTNQHNPIIQLQDSIINK